MRLIFLSVILVGLGCAAEKSGLEDALKQAVSFDAGAKQIRKTFIEFSDQSPTDAANYISSKLGSNNLSSFLLAYPLDELSVYKIDFVYDPIKVDQKCSVHGKSLIEFNDITNLVYTSASGRLTGSFDINASDIQLFGVCEFEAVVSSDKVSVQRLTIPPRTRSNTNSLVVFDKRVKPLRSEPEWKAGIFFEEISDDPL